MKRSTHIPGLTGGDSRNHRKIAELDWSKQWDIVLFSGRRYISMVITDVDGEALFVHNSRIPGYEELSEEMSFGLPLFVIKSITESPKRDACLHPMFAIPKKDCNGSLWRMMYLSSEERKRYDAILMEDMWSRIIVDKIKDTRIYGADTILWITLDSLGRIHIVNGIRRINHGAYCILEDR